MNYSGGTYWEPDCFTAYKTSVVQWFLSEGMSLMLKVWTSTRLYSMQQNGAFSGGLSINFNCKTVHVTCHQSVTLAPFVHHKSISVPQVERYKAWNLHLTVWAAYTLFVGWHRRILRWAGDSFRVYPGLRPSSKLDLAPVTPQPFRGDKSGNISVTLTEKENGNRRFIGVLVTNHVLL